MRQRLKQYLPIFIGCMIFSFFIYHTLVANGLVNTDDGLWEYSYYKSGKWSISLGRWFSPYLDRLRFGIQTEPLNALTALACYSAGLVVILDLFSMDIARKVSYLVCALFLSSVSICITLSYRFMSPNFALAFLLAVAAAWIVIKVKKPLPAVLCGGVLIAIAMGLYQAYIGCTCIVLLGYFLISLCDEKRELKAFFLDILKSFGTAVVGCMLYFLILTVHLRFFHLGLADYNGANTYSIVNTIKNINQSIPYMYKSFSRYYFEGFERLNMLQSAYIYQMVFLVAVLFGLKEALHLLKASKVRALLFVLLAAALPLACNAVLFITTGAWVSLHMTIPMALGIPVLLCVEARIGNSGKLWRWCWRFNIIILLVVLYGNIYQVQVDQQTMLESRTSATMLGERIIDRLDATGNLDPDAQYCVLGQAINNDLYKVTSIMEYSNAYAVVGSWNGDLTCVRRSWQSVFGYLCGIDLEICSIMDYIAIAGDPMVQDMPIFPADGSIVKIGDIVVVKVSE